MTHNLTQNAERKSPESTGTEQPVAGPAGNVLFHGPLGRIIAVCAGRCVRESPGFSLGHLSGYSSIGYLL